MRARRLFAVALAFVAGVAVFSATRGDDQRAAAGPRLDAELRPAADTGEEIRRLQAAVRGGAPREAELAAAYLQKARETGDPTFYARADGLLERALGRGPADPAELVEAATLAAGRHDFRGALALARRARSLAPESTGADPVLVDALVELGRYRAAERALQRLVDTKPNLAGYARVSYLRELHGDLDGAVRAMRLAAAAGGPVRENVASVHALLGDLELNRGRLAAARRAYAAALAAVPGHIPAMAGRARLASARAELAGRTQQRSTARANRTRRLSTAIARWRRIVARLPLPEYVIALGEVELAAGRGAAARDDLALVPAQRRLLGDAGVNANVEYARFAADHGDPARGVRLARRAWEAAPGVRSADALGWALSRAGRADAGHRWMKRALRLGWLDPTVRFHAGMAALAAGRRADGRRHLQIALAHGLPAHPWQADRARRALEER